MDKLIHYIVIWGLSNRCHTNDTYESVSFFVPIIELIRLEQYIRIYNRTNMMPNIELI